MEKPWEETGAAQTDPAPYAERLWPKLRLALSAVLLGTIALSLAGFTTGSASGKPETDKEESRKAIERFWAVYHRNDYQAIPRIQEELQRAIERDPDNPTLYALLGATHFWHVGEAARDTVPHDPTLAQDMPNAVDFFGKALQLDYYTKHLIGYINDDHLPGYLGITTFHLGQQYNSADLMAKGDQMLDFAVYQFPEFNNFNRWAAHGADPKDSATFKKALESLWEGLDSCVGGKVDRANPDLRPYFDLLTSVGRKKACWWEGDLAPYSFEGYLLNLGNGLVKASQVETAKIIFADIQYAGNYSTWPYRQYLEQELNSNLYARAALYADDNTANDPPLSVPNRSCSYCHATVAEPSQ
jgi:hypothetical protein